MLLFIEPLPQFLALARVFLFQLCGHCGQSILYLRRNRYN